MASKSNIALPGRIEVFAGKEAENPILTRWMTLPVAITPTTGPRRAGTAPISISLSIDEDGLKRAAAEQLRQFADQLDPASVSFVAPERSGPEIDGDPLTIKEDTCCHPHPSPPMTRCTAHGYAPAWWCSRPRDHVGPCALRPAWWNIIGRAIDRAARRAGR